jgi:hypothetical protein
MADLELNTDTLGRDLTYDEIVSLLNYGPNHGINVKWFRATGDGVTDDADAINRAINWNSIEMAVTAQTVAGGTTLTFGANLTAAFAARLNAGTQVNVYNVTDPTTIRHVGSGGLTSFYVDNSASVGAGTLTIIQDGILDPVLGTVEVGDIIRFSFAERGRIFFPPGTYLIGEELTFNWNGDNHSLILTGCGDASFITGSFAGYLIDRSVQNPTTGTIVVEKLRLHNGNAAGGGVRIRGVVGGAAVRDCKISAFKGIVCTNGNSWEVSNNKLNWSTTAGSVGIICSNGGTISNNDIVSYDEGIRHGNLGIHIFGGRIEVCNTGILLGKNEGGSNENSSGFVLSGISMESCIEYGIRCYECGSGAIIGVGVTANDGNGVRGIDLSGSSYVTVAASSVAGTFSTCGINADNAGGAVFISVNSSITGGGGTDWLFPSDAEKVELINCSTLQTPTVSQLPTADPYWATRLRLVDDATTTTWSATAAVVGGGTLTVVTTCRNVAGTWTWTIA